MQNYKFEVQGLFIKKGRFMKKSLQFNLICATAAAV